MRHFQNPVYYRKFRHIHVLFSHIVSYLEPSATLHIQNPSIFRTQDMFKTLWRHILGYSECCVTLAYWEFRILARFRILAYLGMQAYSKFCLFRHIQAHSIIIVIITLPLNLYVFEYNDVSFNARLNLLK